MLAAPHPVLIAWGPDLRILYNDAHVPFLDGRHPAIGRPWPDVWPELHAEYESNIKATLRGEAQLFLDRPVQFANSGLRWFTFSWTPLRDGKGEIAGFLSTAMETTERITSVAAERERQEAALRESEERFDLIVEQVRDYAIFMMDLSGRITAWFKGAETVFGWMADDVIGHSFALTFTPEDRASGVPQHELALALREGDAPDVRWHMRKDGSRIFIDGKTATLRNRAGEAIGIVKIGQDVTDRRLKGEQLQQSEERFRLALAAANLGTWRYDASSGEVSMDDRAWSHYDLDPGDMTLEDVLARIHEDDRGAAYALFRAASDPATRTPIHIEYRVRRREGTPRWLLIYGAFYFEEENGVERPVYGIGTTQDITSRKSVEDALRDREERLRLAQQAGGVGTWEWLIRQDEIILSPEAQSLFQSSTQGPVTLAVWQGLIHPADRLRASSAISQALENSGRYEDEYRIVHPDGSLHWLRAVGAIERNTSGDPIVLRGVVIDITERRAAEEKIRLLMREVNHRSKNLLSVVQAIANQTAARDESARSFSERFAERLQGLSASHDLLVRNSWQGVDLADLVRSQLSHFGDELDQRISLSGPPLRVNATAAQSLGMALHELATNASKYGGLALAGGSVTIDWQIHEQEERRRFRLRWHEASPSPITPPSRRGFGSRLLTDMTERAMQGTVRFEFATHDVLWELDAPAETILEPGTQQ